MFGSVLADKAPDGVEPIGIHLGLCLLELNVLGTKFEKSFTWFSGLVW